MFNSILIYSDSTCFYFCLGFVCTLLQSNRALPILASSSFHWLNPEYLLRSFEQSLIRVYHLQVIHSNRNRVYFRYVQNNLIPVAIHGRKVSYWTLPHCTTLQARSKRLLIDRKCFGVQAKYRRLLFQVVSII